MLSKKLTEALEKQVNLELAAAYQYWAMSHHFESLAYKGFAHWMGHHAKEEIGHSRKITQYLIDHGQSFQFQSLQKPLSQFSSLEDVFKAGLEHEKKVTSSIHELCLLAREEKDLATENFLQWFISEQVEEEALFNEIIDRLKIAAGQGAALLLLDKELGSV